MSAHTPCHHRRRHAALAALALATLSACGSAAGTDDATDAVASGDVAADTTDDRGECRPYTPSIVEGRHEGAWSAIDEQVRLPIAIDDVGGGLVHVTATIADVSTAVDVALQGASADEVHPGVIVGSDGESSAGFVFRAQGQHTYELVATAFVSPAPGGLTSYTVSWRYEPLVDCYEANDSLDAARRIPLDTDLEAYAHPGIIEGDGALSGPGLVDFYRFELAAPTTVRLVATRSGDDALTFELWDPATESAIAGTDPLAQGGVASASEAVELAAGTHYVRVGPYGSTASTQDMREALAASWRERYVLRVERP